MLSLAAPLITQLVTGLYAKIIVLTFCLLLSAYRHIKKTTFSWFRHTVRCLYMWNRDITFHSPETFPISPLEIVTLAINVNVSGNSSNCGTARLFSEVSLRLQTTETASAPV